MKYIKRSLISYSLICGITILKFDVNYNQFFLIKINIGEQTNAQTNIKIARKIYTIIESIAVGLATNAIYDKIKQEPVIKESPKEKYIGSYGIDTFGNKYYWSPNTNWLVYRAFLLPRNQKPKWEKTEIEKPKNEVIKSTIKPLNIYITHIIYETNQKYRIEVLDKTSTFRYEPGVGWRGDKIIKR